MAGGDHVVGPAPAPTPDNLLQQYRLTRRPPALRDICDSLPEWCTDPIGSKLVLNHISGKVDDAAGALLEEDEDFDNFLNELDVLGEEDTDLRALYNDVVGDLKPGRTEDRRDSSASSADASSSLKGSRSSTPPVSPNDPPDGDDHGSGRPPPAPSSSNVVELRRSKKVVFYPGQCDIFAAQIALDRFGGTELRRLCTDPCGAVIVEKLLIVGEPHQVRVIIEQMIGGMFKLSCHAVGCRVVQKAIERCREGELLSRKNF